MVDKQANLKQANRRLLRILLLVAVVMFGFGFALWPLYNVFCAATGLGGRGVQELAGGEISEVQNQRKITVRFDATVNSNLDWQFTPDQNTETVQLGKISHASYSAANLSGSAVVGQAVYNIAPPEASLYFVKTECFCFTQQTLAQGERRDMPVTFYVSPDLPADINNITLSYTFFKNNKATVALNESLKKQEAKLKVDNINTTTTNDS